MELQTVWFGLIAVLWIGYFVLEGFDFGVGILLRAIGKTEAERRAIITTLGPLWDGNEVWVFEVLHLNTAASMLTSNGESVGTGRLPLVPSFQLYCGVLLSPTLCVVFH